jgi:hypothetical protein
MVSVFDDASRLLVGFMEGKAEQAQVVQQLLELHCAEPETIAKVFAAKINLVLHHAGSGHFQRAQKAGSALVSVAVGLDLATAKSHGKEDKKGSIAAISKVLLDVVIDMTGGAGRAPKDKAQRAQAASFIVELVAHVGDHDAAKESLLEYAEDKVPAIREKALQGLSHMTADDRVVHRLMVCATDNCKEVRTAAVASISPAGGGRCLGALLARLDDTESCVRETFFNTLGREPQTVDAFGPATLSRLVVGLHDRNHLVQEAAKRAVQKWTEHLGGPLQLLGKCDIFGDEFLGEDCANQLSQHVRELSARQSRQWLQSEGRCFPGLESQAALLSRYALGLMVDDERDNAVDVPTVLRMVREALAVAKQNPSKKDFFLRQMMHIIAILDVCDEVSRRDLFKLSVDILSTAPVSEISDIPEVGNRMKATVQTTVDLGILLLRKTFGIDRNRGRRQAQENQCSEAVMAVVSDIGKDQSEEQAEEDADPHFIALSSKIEVIKVDLEEYTDQVATAKKAKQRAVDDEDFEEAHRQKEILTIVEASLKPLKNQHDALLAERDGICHRILAILSALLRWTQSDIRKDGVLLGMFTGVIQPILRMKALSEEVNLRALHAIGLFSSIDVELAQFHWGFFSKLVQRVREHDASKSKEEIRTNLRRAMLAAATLSDCARLHGLYGFFDRDQILSAASLLAVVPSDSREVSIYPLCGWFMSFGALYFEEHMASPQPEITWALGWMLTEAFSNKVRECHATTQCSNGNSDECSETILKTQATDIMVFFNILSKHPGRHGEAMLCLAVESVLESGLWRRAVSLPTDAHNLQFVRGFSWPKMFEFVRIRLPDAMQLRLWRCCLQVCVTSPALAPWAHIPLALAAGVSNAPPGAAELVKTAIALGADADALAPIIAGLPPLDGVEVPNESSLLQSRAEAVKSEHAYVAELEQVGVRMSEWTLPLDMKVPKGKPSVAVDGSLRAVAMRTVGKAKRGANIRGRETDKALQAAEVESVAVVATPSRASVAGPPQVLGPAPQMEAAVEQKTRGAKRLHGKTRLDANTRDAGDIE